MTNYYILKNYLSVKENEEKRKKSSEKWGKSECFCKKAEVIFEYYLLSLSHKKGGDFSGSLDEKKRIRHSSIYDNTSHLQYILFYLLVKAGYVLRF
jgi:hypothetical protein